MNNTFNFGENIIEISDIIFRISELKNEYLYLNDKVDTLQRYLAKINNETGEGSLSIENSFHEANEDLCDFNSSFHRDEMDTLTEVYDKIVELNGSKDNLLNKILVKDEYFHTFMVGFIDSIVESNTSHEKDEWPYNHITINYQRAIDEKSRELPTINIEGYNYFIY
jgi:hypothetical protein